MERQLAVHAGAYRQALRLAVILACAAPGLASAAPKTPKAKAAFSVGVKAYQKGDYAAASKALQRSFELERDVETLFAWAQTERQLEHCDKASELYEKLLDFDMPAENKAAVRTKLDECKEIIAAAKPRPTPEPEPKPEPRPQPEASPIEPPPAAAVARPWWKNPVGGAFVGVGLVSSVIGTYYLIAGNTAHKNMLDADGRDRRAFESYKAEATTDGQRGVIASAVGGGLIVVGIIWYATHGSHAEASPVVTGWLSPDGSGLAIAGHF